MSLGCQRDSQDGGWRACNPISVLPFYAGENMLFNRKIKTDIITIDQAEVEFQGQVRLIHNSTPEYTPDIAELEQRIWNPVFVPDEFMTLGHKHDEVKDGASGFFPFYEDCYTTEKFTFLEKHLGKMSHAIPFETINDDQLPMWMNKAFRVKGELYALRGSQIISLDNYKRNGVEFDRVKVNINVPFKPKYRTVTQSYSGIWRSDYHSGKTHITTIAAYMYVGKKTYWHEQLSALDNFRPVFVQNDPDRIYVRKYYDYKQQSNV